MDSDYNECLDTIKLLNCSNEEIWRQQRSKNSKNITNLQQKIKKHNETIDAILQLNKREVTKQNLTMQKLFPSIQKVKGDIELIENMMYLVEDTYLNMDQSGKSVLLMFDHQFEHEKAQQMQKSFIQMMNKQNQQEQKENKEEKEKKDLPLIDEEIFEGEVDIGDVEIDNLFATTSQEEKELKKSADEIPDGVIIKEHDSQKETQILEQEKIKKQESEDLRIYEVKDEFKRQIKELGGKMHEELGLLLQKLNEELSQQTKSVSDLESSIMELHHRHAKQIVQIYMETKRLQQEIFLLDDEILSMDAQIYDCEKSNDKAEQCESRKSLDSVVISDLKKEKSFNEGVLKEMEKLLAFEDKNVYEPEPVQETVNVKVDIAPKSQAEIESEKENSAVAERIQRIKEEEKKIEQQMNQQERENEIKEPEHLTEVPEIKLEGMPKLSIYKLEERRQEDDILEQVEKEIQKEQMALEAEVNLPQEKLQIAEKVQVQNQQAEPKLELLRKSKKK